MVVPKDPLAVYNIGKWCWGFGLGFFIEESIWTLSKSQRKHTVVSHIQYVPEYDMHLMFMWRDHRLLLATPDSEKFDSDW